MDRATRSYPGSLCWPLYVYTARISASLLASVFSTILYSKNTENRGKKQVSSEYINVTSYINKFLVILRDLSIKVSKFREFFSLLRSVAKTIFFNMKSEIWKNFTVLSIFHNTLPVSQFFTANHDVWEVNSCYKLSHRLFLYQHQ